MKTNQERKRKEIEIRAALRRYCLSHPNRTWTIDQLAQLIYKRVTKSTRSAVKRRFDVLRPNILDTNRALIIAVKNDKGETWGYRFATEREVRALLEWCH